MFSDVEIALILATKASIKLKLEQLQSMIDPIVERGTYYVSGGCIASLIQGETPNDYDVYFRDVTLQTLVTDTLAQKFPVAIAEVSEKYREFVGVNGLLITENAMTLKSNIQLITKHCGEPSVVRQTFDFMHCMPFYDTKDDKLHISQEQLHLIVNKKLKVNNPDSLTRYREIKFLERGYTWPMPAVRDGYTFK
jgi:hypothetical protein